MSAFAPFLTGVYFVLALLVRNQSESVPWADLRWPIVTAVLSAALSLLVGRLSTGTWAKAAILGVAAVTAFSAFGLAIQAATTAGWAGPDTNPSWHLAGTFGALAGLAFWLRRTPRALDGVARYLTLVATILVAASVLRLGLARSTPLLPADTLHVGTKSSTSKPDIYLVILDKYTSSRALREHYGLDITAFEDALRERGFIVPRDPRANYVNTFLALAAMLNGRYLDDLPARFGRNTEDQSLVHPLIEENQLARFLQARGYRFVFFRTAFPFARGNRIADLELPSAGRLQSEFVVAWRFTTAIPVLHRWVCAVVGCVVEEWPYVPESAALLDWKLAAITSLPHDRPLFALLHLALPHEPYLYDADCQHRPPFWPVRDNGVWEPLIREAYVAQIQCLNRKLLTLVDTLQRRSRVPPIILLQADHGHGRLGRQLPDLDVTTLEQRDERLSVFAAYALPGVDPRLVPDAITPVNITRLVLREYFAADLPPLRDASYWSPILQPYRFTRVR